MLLWRLYCYQCVEAKICTCRRLVSGFGTHQGNVCVQGNGMPFLSLHLWSSVFKVRVEWKEEEWTYTEHMVVWSKQ